jgi:hypothetical protein
MDKGDKLEIKKNKKVKVSEKQIEKELIHDAKSDILITKILELINGGIVKDDIYQLIKKEYTTLSKEEFEKLHKNTLDVLTSVIVKKRKYLIEDHLNIYDELIRVNLPYTKLHITVLKAMEQKEKLLGLHKSNINFNQQNNSLNVDFSNLSVEELEKLLGK